MADEKFDVPQAGLTLAWSWREKSTWPAFTSRCCQRSMNRCWGNWSGWESFVKRRKLLEV